MSDQKRSFSENLDLLIKLLRKLKDKSTFLDMPGVPKLFFANFDYFLDNYERMKDQITEQLLQQFGEPIKQMVADMVDQLQSELGEDLSNLESFPPAAPKKQIQHTQKKTIQEIDELLKKPDLTSSEIDQLLDERSKLKNNNPDKIEE
jgi:hypothetical protein